uniref:WW domain-binding protein 11 isoform X1 n=1 Tax=Rhizophora mucronata TaxID=61149 RepID=A0A2P2IX73_RHIMU
MNTLQFMDKQIMDLTASSSSPEQGAKDFLDLMNRPEKEAGQDGVFDARDVIKKEEIVPSYDFHPIRPIDSTAGFGGSAALSPTAAAVSGRTWSSTNALSNSATAVSSIRNYSSLDSVEPAKVITEKDRDVFNAAIVSEVDRTMKKHVDNLLHALEGVSARLTQLESRTRHLEGSVDDLKVSVGNNHGSTDGKMRQLENILREVQSGVQILKDKQEIVDTQLQLAKLQILSPDMQQSKTQNTGQNDAVQQGASAPLQSHQQLPPPVTFPQSIPSVPIPVPPPAVPPPPIPQHNMPPPAPVLNQFPQNQVPSVPQRDPYYAPPGQSPEIPPQQYQVPPSQQPQPSPAALPHLPYQPPPQPQYSQPPLPSQPQPSLGQHPEETSYMPPHVYPASMQQLSSQPPTGPPPSQPFYGASSAMYEPQSGRSSSGFAPAYVPLSGPAESYPLGGSPSQYGGSPAMKPQQHSSPTISQSGASGYPQLPTARVLPHALPTASGIGGGSNSSGTGNRVPIDDVVDKVASMGFPREHVRATVRKLTENGQSVDLNIVLDKLMNDGEIQPPRGWFGR